MSLLAAKTQYDDGLYYKLSLWSSSDKADEVLISKGGEKRRMKQYKSNTLFAFKILPYIHQQEPKTSDAGIKEIDMNIHHLVGLDKSITKVQASVCHLGEERCSKELIERIIQ